MKKTLLLLTLASLALASCGTLEISLDVTATPTLEVPTLTPRPDTPVPPPPPTFTAIPGLTLDELANAKFHSVSLAEDEADFRFKDGLHYLPEQAQGWGGDWYVRLLMDRVAFGDLDGDGIDDAALIIESKRGGSGLFRELAVVLNRGGSPVNVASTYLGDRVGILSIGIDHGVILLDMLVHGPYDPMLGPSVEKLFRYQWNGTVLVPLD